MSRSNDKLYVGACVIIDFESIKDMEVIDHFMDQSNFEGYATIKSIGNDYVTIEGCDCNISIEHIVVLC